MQNTVMQKAARRLLPTVLILYICQILLFPLAVDLTLADKGSGADYTLSYTQNKLSWGSVTDTLPDGTVVIDLFSPEYDGTVSSGDGRDLTAPGTADSRTIRVQNHTDGSITYTAAAYIIKGDAALPLIVRVKSSGTAAAAASYPLPAGVTQDQVVQAITGAIGGRQSVELDAAWSWAFEESALQDAIDTRLGISGGSTRVSVGLYIVVEDNNAYVTPDTPSTGDGSHIGLYLGLMLISLILLILLLLDRRREGRGETD